jgi:hypothetical protein
MLGLSSLSLLESIAPGAERSSVAKLLVRYGGSTDCPHLPLLAYYYLLQATLLLHKERKEKGHFVSRVVCECSTLMYWHHILVPHERDRGDHIMVPSTMHNSFR